MANMAWTSFFKSKFLKDLGVAFFGVSAALFVNSLYEGCQKKDSYVMMTKSIIEEARDNSQVLNTSFIGQIKDLTLNSTDSIIIYRDLKTSATENYLQNDNFISHVPDSAISTLSNYILILRKMNAFRSAYQRYLEDKHNNFLLYHIRNAIVEDLGNCDSICQKVVSLNFQK
jgi:hypothetical protein